MFLELKQVGKRYKDQQNQFEVFSDIDLSIEENQFVSILGPSGCGKSTLLSMIAGLENVTEGTILLEGKKSVNRARTEGWFFKNLHCFLG